MDKIPPGPVLWAGCSLSASPHMLDAPNPNLHGDRLTPLHLCCAGEPRTRLSIPAGVSSGLRRGKVSPPLTWWQHSSWYSSGSCWTFLGTAGLCATWCPAGPLGPLLQSPPVPQHILMLGIIPPQGAGLCISLFWTSWGLCTSISPPCQCPSAWQQSYLMN